MLINFFFFTNLPSSFHDKITGDLLINSLALIPNVTRDATVMLYCEVFVIVSNSTLQLRRKFGEIYFKERAMTLYNVICKYEAGLSITQMKGDWEFEIETDEHNSIFTSFFVETTRIHNHIEKAKSKRWFKDKQGQQSPHKYMKEKKREKGKGYTKGSPPVLSHRHVYLQFHGPPWLLRIAKGTLRQTCTPQYCYSLWNTHLHLNT